MMCEFTQMPYPIYADESQIDTDITCSDADFTCFTTDYFGLKCPVLKLKHYY